MSANTKSLLTLAVCLAVALLLNFLINWGAAL